jgi:2',3'-cyclic-nucleotide 2'-phosphodiesterase (5'-nucleotidase family)
VTEPCGCHSTPHGGIDREYNAVKKERAESRSVLYVDAGNGLGPEKLAAPVEVHQKKALALVEMLNTAGLQMYAPGPLDLALGVPFLKDAQKKAQFKFINASLKNAEGETLFEPYAIADFRGFKVAVTGISPQGKSGEWYASEPDKAVEEALATTKGKADWLIVLSHLPEPENERLAKKYPDVKIFVGCDPNVTIENPYFMGKTKNLVLDPHAYGYRLGRFEAIVKRPFKGFFSISATIRANQELEAWQNLLEKNQRVEIAKANIRRIQENKLLTSLPGGTQISNSLIWLSKKEYGKANEITQMLKQCSKLSSLFPK